MIKVHSNLKTYVIEGKKDPSRTIRAQHNQLRPWYNAPAYLQRSSMFLPALSDSDYESLEEPVSEFVPGLRNFVPSRTIRNKTQWNKPESVSLPTFPAIPGLGEFKFVPGGTFGFPAISIPVSTPVSASSLTPHSSTTGTDMSNVSVTPLDSLARRASTPVIPREGELPVRLPSFNSSPVLHDPFDSFPSISLAPMSRSQSVPDFSLSTQGNFETVDLDFSGFDMPNLRLDSSLSSVSGSLYLPSMSQNRNDHDTDDYGQVGSSLDSLCSFREQSANSHSPFEGFTGLNDLFRDSFPLTSFSEAEPSGDESDVSEYTPGARNRIDFTPDSGVQPRRLTRRQRTELCPGIDVDTALELL